MISRMEAPESGVRVRMYRPRGLGDCFLLAFRGEGDQARYMLIDCGVFVGTPGAKNRLAQIAGNIAAATGGRLDVLVATHEHWDHLCGFQYAEDIFDNDLEIEDVWLAWTEDPAHPVAERLRKARETAFRALRAAVQRLAADGDPSSGTIEEVLRFHGDAQGALAIGSTAEQMSYARCRVENPKYWRPGGDPVAWEDAGVRFYMLGPPEDEEFLRRSNPSSADSEVYELRLALNRANAFYAPVLATEMRNARSRRDNATVRALDDLETPLLDPEFSERARPFDESWEIPCDFLSPPRDPQHRRFFERHYGFAGHGGKEASAWRRVNSDWLSAAAELALALDGDTNNTSLAFAIELIDSGRVLLFPGDAQVGNWLSWSDLEWGVGESGGTVTGEDLIRRTVFYKVGHHGSHNATLRDKGLEMMESPELVAMIPVDGGQADRKGWEMPFEPLYKRLKEKTRGRILRADTGMPTKKPSVAGPDEWDAFRRRVKTDKESGEDLWIEYTVTE